jgi:chromosome segregation ATPase
MKILLAMSSKVFTFNASSFTLDPSLESFLRSKNAISMDFGAAAYLNSDLMPQILAELINGSNAAALSASNQEYLSALRLRMGELEVQCEKITLENRALAAQTQAQLTEIASLKEQASSALGTVETLEAENIRLQHALSNASNQVPKGAADNETLRQSFKKLQMELQQVRSQSIEAITSLKVLEDENEELRRELENLRGKQKTVPSQQNPSLPNI